MYFIRIILNQKMPFLKKEMYTLIRNCRTHFILNGFYINVTKGILHYGNQHG